MDRKKEEAEEQPIKSSKQPALTPLITTSSTTAAATNLLITTTDDDTSTESSDTFETWTLVNDKEKCKSSVKIDDSENRLEILKHSDDEEEETVDEKHPAKNIQEQQLQDYLHDATNDDFSDGISIISESESVGRISPHGYRLDHLHDLNLKFSLADNMEDTILHKLRVDMETDNRTPLVIQQEPSDYLLRQRRRSSSSSAKAKESQALQKVSQTVATSLALPPLVKRGLQGIFYVGVGLAILALIGKIVNPTWQPLANVVTSTAPSSGELEQKVNDMELQNNLMRAEIDLLNKQVKYLTTLNDPQQQQQQQQHKQGKYKDYKEGKTFKVWSGNGDSLKPLDITKEDLRKPYKCPDGSFVEIANMCMEQKQANEPSIVDQFGQVVKDLKEQSEAFKTFEKVAEELQAFQDNPFEQLQNVLGEGPEDPQNIPQNEFIKNKPIYETPEDFKRQTLPPYSEKYQKPRPKGEEPPAQYKQQHKYNKGQGKYEDNSKSAREYKKSFGKDYNAESKDFKKFPDQEKFRHNSKESNEWKTNDKFNNNSKERKAKKFNSHESFDDSKENSAENNSKERYNRQKRKFDKKDDDDDSGEWQEKYMKHRENQRKQNEQKYQENKNWYIKRGDSREHKRSGEKQYR